MYVDKVIYADQSSELGTDSSETEMQDYECVNTDVRE